MKKNIFILIFLTTLISFELQSQEKLDYRFGISGNTTIPIFSYGTFNNKNAIKIGRNKIGYTCSVEVIKKFNSFFIGLNTKFDHFGYSYEADLLFPEDGPAGTRSSIVASNVVSGLGIGIEAGSRLFNSNFFVSVGPQIEFEVYNKAFQQIIFGFNPNIINIKDDKESIYESGLNTIVSINIGTRGLGSSKVGLILGSEFNINKYKYYTFNWDVRPIKILIGITYNIFE
ncbi:MAG TPA: hypothetical protein VFG10_09905 [Saprospiraceae bacterium]|nr:hypothetical protein [Saprospiraceae bacterium]